jgi:endoglucanase
VKELIKRLVEAYGPSGSEDQVRRIIEEEVGASVDEIRVDPLGNLIATRRGKGTGGKKIMVAGHMDEIGVMVTHIDDKGFLRFGTIGGVNPMILLGERVVFADGTVGIVGSERLEDQKDLRSDRLFIDIGAKDRAQAEKAVGIGHSAGYYRPFEDLGDRLVAKSMDDRIGCAVIIQAARELKKTPNQVSFVFTVQEEVGLRGARTAAFAVEPDLGIAVDVTRTGDTPKGLTMAVELGGGAAIKVKDSSLVAHPKVKGLMAEVARAENIPHQFEVLEQGGTDAGAIHLTREGVPSGTISIPTRYIHTPSEIVDYGDVQACVRLLTAILGRKIDW